MTPNELADDYVAFRKRVDTFTNLWMGDLTHLEAWGDPSPAGTAETVARYREYERLARRLADGAPDAERALLHTIAATAHLATLEVDLEVEILVPNREVGLLGLLVPFLPRYPLATAEHGDRYLAKLAAFPAYAEALAVRLAEACARGVAPLRSHAEATIAALDRRIADPSRWYAQPAPTEGYGGWEEALRSAVDGPLVEGFRVYRAALATHAVPNGRGDDQPGLVHLPGGEAAYEALVKAHTTLDLSAEEVHRMGLQQVDRLAEEYREIAGPLAGTTEVPAILDWLRSDPDLHYSSAEAIVADAEAALARAEAEAPNWFARMPEAGCDAVAIDGGGVAFYSDPPEAGGNGTFFFNTADPSMWTTFGLEAIAYHESVPGHHFQFALAIEDDSLHHVQQRMYVGAFNEGWGLYTERLADEMGLYTSELARVGMLQADSMRACRLVVDTGMHALGWSRQRAIDYMIASSPMNLAEVTAEIDRYIVMPGQAVSYMVGRLHIERLRAHAEQSMGERFDIKAFHEAVLGAGTVTLPILTERVEAWAGTT